MEIETTVYPAYGRLIDYFSKLDEKAEGNHGVWALPDGDELYELALRLFTTTDYSPEEIHRIGLAEIERYFVMPGQACSYKVGMMKIVELREKAQEELGERFDLRDFHRVVLTNGSVPLTLLETLVDEYIAAES